MSRIIYISGGARSGKSRLGEQLAIGFGAPLCYLATGEAKDPEMAERIHRHRARRGPDWRTVEEPLDLCRALRQQQGLCSAILVDCMTLWITNLLLRHNDPVRVLREVGTLIELFPALESPCILISNEVGMGIVPENSLARTFRDLAGEANEMLAGAADEAYVMFSGLPLRLK